jgi:hypothetical protein
MSTANHERTGNLSASLALLLSPAALTAVNKSDDDYVQSVRHLMHLIQTRVR